VVVMAVVRGMQLRQLLPPAADCISDLSVCAQRYYYY
jgi:hypothetical protein